MTEKRQRIEGSLHRILPAKITIREAEPATEGSAATDDGLLRLHVSASSEIRYLRQSFWDEPWIEVLGHDPGECDLSRFESGAGVVMANHDRTTAIGNTPLASIGVIENATMASGRMEADLILSRREALSDLRQDIADDLVRNVSVGYNIDERILVRQGKNGEPDEYRVTKWMPFEISLVDIPADATVGVGRELDAPDQKNPQSRYRVIDLTAPSAGAQPLQGERSMNANQAPAAEQQTAPRIEVTDNAAQSAALIAAERDRARDIRATGRQLGMEALAEKAVDDGTSIDAFRALAIGALKDGGKIRQAESADIGMSPKDVEKFSFCRALLAASDPIHAHDLAPFEMECSRAAQDKRPEAMTGDRKAAITIPVDVLNRGIGITPDIAASAQRMIAMRNMQRDLTVGSATGGGNLVATELLGTSFIELLRNAMILDKLGVTWLKDLVGNIAIPSQTGAATGYWLSEGDAPTESQQTIGQVPLTPKTVGGFTDYTRKLLQQASLDVEAFVRADLATVLGLTIQTAAFNGSGSAPEPYGVLNTSGIGAVAGGDNGAVPTYSHMVDLETAIGNANADIGNLAFVTNSKVRGKLRKTLESASAGAKWVYTNGRERGIGDILGYDAFVTNSVPSTLVKGTSGSTCSAIMFGNWASMMIGMWGGLDLMLDPYALATSGGKRVIALQDVDIAIRHVGSFAAMKDVLTTA